MTEPKRHVSRWHAATPTAAAIGTPDGATDAAAEAQPEVSLRYLNEFVGKLQCASALLDHKLYPDAKEITESMGVFNAVRKYVLQDDQEVAAEHFAALAAASTDSTAAPAPKADGIVVVGDGSTLRRVFVARTAAMFAHRLRHWKSYSIDPAMEYRSSERSLGWETILNLVVIRNKIENVRITLRRAIVVLVHAHVTLEQALSAVDAETIVGVVTLPCCNWFSKQEALFGRHPDLVYDDFSILSDKREVRLWVGGERSGSASSEELALSGGVVISDAEIKVCIPKTFRAGKLTSETDQEGDSAATTDLLEAKDPSVKAAAETRYVKVFGILKDLLLLPTKPQQEPVSSQEKQQHNKLPVELKPRLTPESHILVLDSRAAKAVASGLLRDGHRHVYILGEPTDIVTRTTLQDSDEDNHAFQDEAMTIPLVKLTFDQSEKVIEELQGPIRIATKELTLESLENEDDDVNSGFDVTFQSHVSTFERIDCVVDNRFLYRGFRGESRNAALFRKLCSLVHRVAAIAKSDQDDDQSTLAASPSFICITPRRNWRKKDYLSHEVLQFEVQGVPVKQRLPESWELKDRSKRDQELTFIYCCRKIHRGDADRKQATCELENQQSMKDTVLAMKQTMQQDFDAVEKAIEDSSKTIQALSVQQVIELAPQAAEIDPSVVANRTYVQVLGEISNVRRYTKGMAFLSLAPPQFELEVDANSRNSEFDPRNPLQVFLQLQELKWSPELFRDVLLMLHTGDQVRVLGFLKKSERGTPVLSVAAISFVRGEFEAYA